MPTTQSAQVSLSQCETEMCVVCHCTDEGCDGTVCHGLDAD